MASLSTSLPAELKAIKPFILRGAEVEKYALSSGVPEQRRVAYYCFMHAMEKAVESAHSQEPAVQDYLMQLMIKLEKDKAELSIEAANTELDRELVKKNALTVFKKADDADRAGAADKSTARNFNVASNFFDVLVGMGETNTEIMQMRKYAQFKALDILRALKEGRQPTPGVPGADGGGLAVNNSPMPSVPDDTPTTNDTEDDDVVLSGGGASSAPYPPAGGGGMPPMGAMGASAPPPYSAPQAPHAYHPAPTPAPAAAHSPATSVGASASPAGSVQPPAPYVPPTRVSPAAAAHSDESACVAKGTRVHFRNDAMSDAWKLARHALRAMEMDDAGTAAHYLQQAQTALSAAQ